KWCIYPMYDFTHCISDAIEGITHSLCTLEFQDNRRLYDWVLDNISIECHPRQYEFSRLNLEYSIMSKRKLNLLVTEKVVEGWDDPRMPTISGLRRRGYTAASIREFCRRIGVTKQDNNVEMMALESCIRDDLNENAPRAMAVLDPIKVVIENRVAGEEWLTMPNHPNNPDMGTRQVPFDSEIYIDRADFREEANKQYKRLVLGKEVRLRNAYVIKAERVEKDAEGNVTTLYCSYDAETLNKDPADGRKVKGVIHWVSVKHALPAEIRLYDRLFSVPNPAAAEDFLSTINPESLIIRQGFVEPSLADAVPEKTYQFEREGYFCADSHYSRPDALVFNRTVGLRDTWAA
ncbi:glutamine--tRNA ligase, partial [Yersinia enterocolitica]